MAIEGGSMSFLSTDIADGAMRYLSSGSCPAGFVIPDDPTNPDTVFVNGTNCAYSCEFSLLIPDDYDHVSDMATHIGIAGLILATLLVIVFAIDSSSYKNYLILWMGYGSLVLSASVVALGMTPSEKRFCADNANVLHAGDGPSACVAQSFTAIYFGGITILSWLFICVDMLYKVLIGKRSTKYIGMHRLAVFGAPLVPLVVLIVQQDYGYARGGLPFCYVTQEFRSDFKEVLVRYTMWLFVLGGVGLLTIIAVIGFMIVDAIKTYSSYKIPIDSEESEKPSRFSPTPPKYVGLETPVNAVSYKAFGTPHGFLRWSRLFEAPPVSDRERGRSERKIESESNLDYSADAQSSKPVSTDKPMDDAADRHERLERFSFFGLPSFSPTWASSKMQRTPCYQTPRQWRRETDTVMNVSDEKGVTHEQQTMASERAQLTARLGSARPIGPLSLSASASVSASASTSVSRAVSGSNLSEPFSAIMSARTSGRAPFAIPRIMLIPSSPMDEPRSGALSVRTGRLSARIESSKLEPTIIEKPFNEDDDEDIDSPMERNKPIFQPVDDCHSEDTKSGDISPMVVKGGEMSDGHHVTLRKNSIPRLSVLPDGESGVFVNANAPTNTLSSSQMHALEALERGDEKEHEQSVKGIGITAKTGPRLSSRAVGSMKSQQIVELDEDYYTQRSHVGVLPRYPSIHRLVVQQSAKSSAGMSFKGSRPSSRHSSHHGSLNGNRQETKNPQERGGGGMVDDEVLLGTVGKHGTPTGSGHQVGTPTGSGHQAISIINSRLSKSPQPLSSMFQISSRARRIEQEATLVSDAAALQGCSDKGVGMISANQSRNFSIFLLDKDSQIDRMEADRWFVVKEKLDSLHIPVIFLASCLIFMVPLLISCVHLYRASEHYNEDLPAYSQCVFDNFIPGDESQTGEYFTNLCGPTTMRNFSDIEKVSDLIGLVVFIIAGQSILMAIPFLGFMVTSCLQGILIVANKNGWMGLFRAVEKCLEISTYMWDLFTSFLEYALVGTLRLFKCVWFLNRVHCGSGELHSQHGDFEQAATGVNHSPNLELRLQVSSRNLPDRSGQPTPAPEQNAPTSQRAPSRASLRWLTSPPISSDFHTNHSPNASWKYNSNGVGMSWKETRKKMAQRFGFDNDFTLALPSKEPSKEESNTDSWITHSRTNVISSLSNLPAKVQDEQGDMDLSPLPSPIRCAVDDLISSYPGHHTGLPSGANLS